MTQERKDEIILTLRSLRHNEAVIKTLIGFSLALAFSLIMKWAGDSLIWVEFVAHLFLFPTLVACSETDCLQTVFFLLLTAFLIISLHYVSVPLFCIAWGFHYWICSLIGGT